VPHAYNPGATAPRWLRFLDEVMGGDAELVAFLRRALGYSLAGHTREQVFFILFGRGSNGKSLLLAVVRHVLGDLAHVAAFETFEDSRGHKQHPEAVAELYGRRFVAASETKERATLDEGRVKSIAHGDTLSARAMYGNRFTFDPSLKLWLATNHKPKVLDDSTGFWRSVRLIPFGQTFDPQAEPNLLATLKSEAEGVLADLVAAAREWYATGLQAPECVLAAGAEWQEQADPLAEFLATRCMVSSIASASAKALYQAYLAWAETEGLQKRDTLSRTAFGRRLGERFDKIRPSGGKPTEYVGIGLLFDPEMAGESERC